jgi:hypothetical protein
MKSGISHFGGQKNLSPFLFVQKMNKTQALEILSRIDGFKIRHAPGNNVSIHLPNGMLDSNDVAARGFRGTAGRVLGNFRVVDPEKKSNLFP